MKTLCTAVLAATCVALAADAQQAGSISISATTDDGRTVRERIRIDEGGVTWGRGSSAAGGLDSQPVQLLRRFYELDEEADAAADALQARYDAQRAEAIAEIERRLGEAYVDEAVALLPAASREEFLALRALVTAHERAIADAESAYIEAVTTAGVPVLARMRGDRSLRPDQIVYNLPGLTEEERDAVRTIAQTSSETQREEVRAKLADQGIERPGRGSDRGNWREYMTKSRELGDEVYRDHRDRLAIEIGAALNADTAETYETVLAAAEALETKRTDADEALKTGLTELLGEERAAEALESGRSIWEQWMRRRR